MRMLGWLGLLVAASATADEWKKHGLSEAQWQKLTAGQTVSRPIKQGQRTVLRGYFIARATPEELFALITDYPQQPRLYKEMKSATVREKSDKHAVVHYRSKLGFIRIDWVARDTYSKDRRTIQWTLVADPKVKSKLRRADGFWKFSPVGAELTLVTYQNDVALLRLPARLLRAFAAANMPGIASNWRRELARRRARPQLKPAPR